MRFSNLQELLRNSSSSRQYLLSLPTAVQLQLHTQNSWIHTQYELRRNAHAISENREGKQCVFLRNAGEFAANTVSSTIFFSDFYACCLKKDGIPSDGKNFDGNSFL